MKNFTRFALATLLFLHSLFAVAQQGNTLEIKHNKNG